MRHIGAAAAADQIESVFLHEAFHPARHRVRAKRVAGGAIDQLRQSGIRLHADQAGPVAGQPADMLGHFLWASGTVQADQRDIQRVDHGGGGGDVRPHQQGAGGLHRHLHEDGRVALNFRARDLGGVHRRLDLQRVLARLDQERVHVAIHQAAALLRQACLQRVVIDIS